MVNKWTTNLTILLMLFACVGTIQAASSVTVAAYDSLASAKARADYVCDGVDDEVELLASITAHAATESVSVDPTSNQTISVSCLVKHSVEWLPGTYNLSSTLVIPDSSDCVIRAKGSRILGPSSGSAVIIRGMNSCRYNFGNIKCSSIDPNDAALKISPTSAMPAVLSSVVCTGLKGTSNSGTGLWIDPSVSNIWGNSFTSYIIYDFQTGILVDDAAQYCQTNRFLANCITRVNQCVYEKGVKVEKNVWNIDINANLEGSQGVRTSASHGRWLITLTTSGYEGINEVLILNVGASYNIVETHPPIGNFPWRNNSGNYTNIILSADRPPYKNNKNVIKKWLVDNDWI